MPHDQQVKAIGAANYKLLKAGVVRWTEIVTPYRVRTLREVLVLGDVTAAAAIEAGVRPAIVEAALAGGELTEAELDREYRAELVGRLRAARASQADLVAAIGRGATAAAAVAGGVGVQLAPTAIAAVPHAAELAAELAKWRPARRRLKAEL